MSLVPVIWSECEKKEKKKKRKKEIGAVVTEIERSHSNILMVKLQVCVSQ